MPTFKAVQIGCGGRGQTHAIAVAQVERLTFAATCHLIEDKAKTTAQANNVPLTCTDFRALLETERPDVVGFAASPAVRSEVILPILE